ncbi:MAG: hypothetical protein MR966_10440 [Lachnospiraceae bacterium]|nr:hypothetical protein [Lachnospiraceae bacterium]
MKKKAVVLLTITVLIEWILNYLWPSPWNIHALEMWLKLFVMTGILAITSLILVGLMHANTMGETKKNFVIRRIFLGAAALPFVVILVIVIGLCTGFQIFHADDYADILPVEEVDSVGMILSEDDSDSIALMDTASAKQLGDREIGSIQNFSAFNVSEDYIQLNVNGDAVKAAPLEYAGFFKWMKNKDSGATGYVTVSPTTMTADYVELPEGMKYIPSAYFSMDLNRHLHQQFPTLIFNNSHFEIDEEGNPWYISSVYTKTIGLFNGDVVTGAIITNPITGESQYFDLEDVPEWADDVVDGILICDLYNLSYKNKNGFWNGTFVGANTGCRQVTSIEYGEDDERESGADFGYIAQDGDIYIYTGVTSMAADSSNLGFIMANERTGECRYFQIPGANEQSAMNAAEGEVQQYSYLASFPTLINVDGELTYLGVLKDNAGLVKMYYTVNVKDYGKVVVASSREECISRYIDKMGLNPPQEVIDNLSGEIADSTDDGSSSAAETEAENVEFTIAVMQYADVEGNTWVYMGTENGIVYKAKFADNEMLLYAKTGDVIRGTIRDGKVTVKEVKTAESE